ncbi:TPA: SIR2 family protein [Pseudomonas aeruginosa]
MTFNTLREIQPIVERIEEILKLTYESNEDFNARLDELEPINVARLGPYRPSAVLFWTDRASYLRELEEWTSQRARECHEDALAYLRKTEQIPLLLDLAKAINLHRITPFVGAGLSVACEYPMWGQALKKLAARLQDVLPENIEPLLNNYEYLRVAQLLKEAASAQVDHFIRTEFRQRPEPIAGPVLLLPKLSSGCVVTTNFDTIIEDLFARENIPLDGYMYGMQPGNNFVQRLLRGERCILKLHGNAGQENTYVFTEEQYRIAYGEPISFGNHLPRALRQIFIGGSLLFLGCSLEQDRTLELFKTVISEASFEIPDHFALLSEPDEKKLKVQKEERLLTLKIRPIWYSAPNHDHSLLEKILSLAIAIAHEEVVLS